MPNPIAVRKGLAGFRAETHCWGARRSLECKFRRWHHPLAPRRITKSSRQPNQSEAAKNQTMTIPRLRRAVDDLLFLPICLSLRSTRPSRCRIEDRKRARNARKKASFPDISTAYKARRGLRDAVNQIPSVGTPCQPSSLDPVFCKVL